MQLHLDRHDSNARRRRLAVAVAVAGCLAGLLMAGCGASGGEDDGDGDSKGSKPRSPSTPSPSPTYKYKYKYTKDLGTCEDGKCTVEVREGDVIPFGEDVRAPDLNIDRIGPAGVDLRFSEPGAMTSTFAGQTPDQGGASTFNETDFRVLEIHGDTAVLRILPTRR
ncbi:hypothetical protein ACFT9I_29935 [Streptomyces sp. NPDC057137]|uniref:hypothetical protein n=1 Tax=Streptomyces sp. NPDC057137 TaxID=3346030 RepID=UPI00363256DA